VSSKLPYLPLFVGDFLAATAEWDGEARALYLLALAHQWAGGSLPLEEGRLCRLLGWELKAFRKAWPQVAGKFEERGGRLYNARLEEHRSKALRIAEKRAEAGKRGAEHRWQSDASANGAGMANGMAPGCHPIQSNPTTEELRSSPEGDLSPSPLSAGPKTALKAAENRRALASLTATTLKGIAR
jgi:uncharacterized protein YdaU (DUF1376 family)